MHSKTNLLIFGGNGDLAMRKLLPSLYRMFVDQRLPKEINIIGVSRSNLSRNNYIELIKEKFAEQNIDDISQFFFDIIDYRQVDFKDASSFLCLSNDKKESYIFYLAVHFDFYVPICTQLKKIGLMADARVVLEKPIGSDFKITQKLNEELTKLTTEENIFRIDHYLGKEAVQNLFALRFSNTVFETLWNRNHISHVEISIAESLGIEERGEFYDKTGAMRDMIQSHLLQLLSIIAMDPPSNMDASNVREEKVKVLKALRKMTPETCIKDTIRGQYEATDEASSYLMEKGISQNSQTESFVALRCWVDNWRWSGVPFFLRTGKCMSKRLGQIIIHFNAVPHPLFPVSKKMENNALVIGLNPNDTLSLNMMAKMPGDSQSLHPVQLNLEFSEHFGVRTRDGYERLLGDIFRGDLTLFLRNDEVEIAWSWVDDILNTWKDHPQHMQRYQSGTWGPSHPMDFISQAGFQWKKRLKPLLKL